VGLTAVAGVILFLVSAAVTVLSARTLHRLCTRRLLVA